MSNNPSAGAGVGILTSFVRNDREAFMTITKELPGGCPEAIAALGRVSEAMVKMIAELAGISKEEALESVALAIAAGD
ncbi:hypothetical protein [Pseudarthrobacter sp. NamB4]|uniref:hypothetical protein n=1 Tax=Pseudarthrobacter sp. NamB4 TaxID=2576837 RepID=UPI0010FE4841|nr:hypothetical protein [Pseudarthrobacter sp. NamB4]TLM73207.1 hypothetical protein FDW81_09195 [Pseudarthrobacter sp. NamB4]